MKQNAIATRVRAQLRMLTATFLLGMAVNLIGLPSEAEDGAKIFTTIFLGLHALLALGLAVGATLTIRLIIKEAPAYRPLAGWGCAVIGLTIITGILTMMTENDWWSYLMAVGFIASAWIYGLLYIRVKRAK